MGLHTDSSQSNLDGWPPPACATAHVSPPPEQREAENDAARTPDHKVTLMGRSNCGRQLRAQCARRRARAHCELRIEWSRPSSIPTDRPKIPRPSLTSWIRKDWGQEPPDVERRLKEQKVTIL